MDSHRLADFSMGSNLLVEEARNDDQLTITFALSVGSNKRGKEKYIKNTVCHHSKETKAPGFYGHDPLIIQIPLSA